MCNRVNDVRFYRYELFYTTIVYLENTWSSKQMITEGETTIPLDTTRRAIRNQSQSKQRSALIENQIGFLDPF